MPQDLGVALAEVRALLLAPGLARAVAAGRRRGEAPTVVRAELRPVALKAGPRLQIVTDDGARPYTRNVSFGPEADAAVDALLAEPFGNWHVETATTTLQVRVTKRGEAQLHRAPAQRAGLDRTGGDGHPPGTTTPDSTNGSATADGPASADEHTTVVGPAPVDTVGPLNGHDRVKEHLLDPDDPFFATVGGSAAKRRQVDAFLRALAATLPAELTGPLRVADLGCGNAYLTFAAYRYLTGRGITVELVGVDVREDQRRRNTALAEQLGCADQVRFVAGTILDAAVDPAPDLVLALHACDTATDEALARAVRWGARWVLAAPCCHHDLAAQLRANPAPTPYEPVVRHGILRERFADILTDALRAALLRLHGYRVEVVEFVDSRHTPRNLLLRARRTGAAPTAQQQAEYAGLVKEWQVTPCLQTLLDRPGPASDDNP
ncbi:class I SAM-dependent methyltransferase [Plantactinospora sonchi]|uniref:class I SAM-dependent methyltransferase n=1 Tax=Plantactinospora sonchi TaxID=1544735 RepID=UPI0038B59BB8